MFTVGIKRSKYHLFHLDASDTRERNEDPGVSGQGAADELKSYAPKPHQLRTHDEDKNTGENRTRCNEVAGVRHNEVENQSDAREGVEEPKGAETEKSKVKGKRKPFTKAQVLALETRFRRQSYLSNEEKAEMAEKLGLAEGQVKTWFQNRR